MFLSTSRRPSSPSSHFLDRAAPQLRETRTAAPMDRANLADQRAEIAIEPDTRDDACLVRLRGEISLANSGEVARALLGLLNDGVARVVVDLDAVEFMDSSGIHALRRAAQHVPGSGHELRIINPVGPVGRLFALTRAESVLPIVDR
jgi:anti-sigma B factor antagonist